MIKVSRLNRQDLMVNSDLIELIEENPDTVISLTSGKKLVVSESAHEVLRRIIEFRKAIAAALPQVSTNLERGE